MATPKENANTEPPSYLDLDSAITEVRQCGAMTFMLAHHEDVLNDQMLHNAIMCIADTLERIHDSMRDTLEGILAHQRALKDGRTNGDTRGVSLSAS